MNKSNTSTYLEFEDHTGTSVFIPAYESTLANDSLINILKNQIVIIPAKESSEKVTFLESSVPSENKL